MSALLTHAFMGLLLGMALGVRLRYLPWTFLLGMLPDVDHLDQFGGVPVVTARLTFHNVWFCIALPLAVLAFCYLRRARPDVLRLAAAAPVILSSHLLLDLLPIEPFGGLGKLPLLYPFSGALFTIPAHELVSISPLEYSTFTVLLAVLLLMVALTLLALRAQASMRDSASRHVPALTLLVAWILFVPLVTAGLLIAPTPAPNAVFTMEAPRLELPQSRISTVVHHVGGQEAGPNSLVLEVRANGTLVASVRNPATLEPGRSWYPVVAIPGDARTLPSLTVYLNATRGNASYAHASAKPLLAHADANLRASLVATGARNVTLLLENDGPEPVPAGALDITVTGVPTVRRTNADPLDVGGAWGTVLANASRVHLRVSAVDDKHVYLDTDVALETP